MGKDKIVYLSNDEDLVAFTAAHKGKKYQVQRFKGYELVWPLTTFPLIGGVAA